MGSEKELKGEHVLGYEGVWRHLIANHDSSFQVREQSCHSLKSSIKYTNVIDRRNHLVLPTKGAYLKTSVELAGLGGDVTFVRANADYQISKKLFKYFVSFFVSSFACKNDLFGSYDFTHLTCSIK